MSGALKAPWDRVSIAGLAGGAADAHGVRRFLRDCPDRRDWNGEPPRELSFREVNKQALFFAAQMETVGLKAGARLLLLLPNMVELAIALIGARALGLVPVIVPLEESVDALSAAAERVGAQAIITTARCEELRLGERSRQIAAKVMGIRLVAGFGFDLPDGVMPLDGWSQDEVTPLAGPLPVKQGGEAIITFARIEGALSAFIRSEAQVVADALAFAARARLGRDAGVIVTLQPGSYAALITGLIAPLFLGMPVQLLGPYREHRLLAAVEQTPGAALVAPAAFLYAVRAARRRGLYSTLSAGVSLRRPGDDTGALAGDLPDIPLFDLQEGALLPLGAWPAEGALALDGEHEHPMEGILPEGAILISLRRLGSRLAIAGGFSEARVIQRDLRRGATDAA